MTNDGDEKPTASCFRRELSPDQIDDDKRGTLTFKRRGQ